MKKKCRSFVFALALFGAAGPALAQNTSPSYSPISLSAPRFGIAHLSEAVIATLQATSVTATVPQADAWDRVRAIAPGTEILVSVNGLYQGRRSFVSADESALMVLMPAGAPLPRVVVRIARADVAEIRAAKVRHTGHTARRSFAAVGGAFAGYFVGAMAGGMIGGAVDCSIGGCADLPAGLFVGMVAGMVTGGVGGGMLGYRAASDKTHDVIYRVP